MKYCKFCGVVEVAPPREHAEGCHIRKGYDSRTRNLHRNQEKAEAQLRVARTAALIKDPNLYYLHQAEDWLKQNPTIKSIWNYDHGCIKYAIAEYIASQDGETVLHFREYS